MDDPIDTYLVIGSFLFVILLCLIVFIRILIDHMRINNATYDEMV